MSICLRKSVPLVGFFWSLLLGTVSVNAQQTGANQYKLCHQCHGDRGEGNMLVGAPAVAGLPAWYTEAQVKKFQDGSRGAHPRDEGGLRMRPMSRMVKAEDLSAVAAYIEAMPAVKPEPTIKGNAFKGKELYAPCSACHGQKAEGNPTVHAPPLRHINDWYLFTQMQNFRHGIRANDPAKDPTGAAMVPMAKMLQDDKAIHDVLSYIQTIE